MATPNPSFNPMLTTNGAGLFQKESIGFVQGNQMPDPATRFSLAQGVVSADETDVMWGGVAIKAFIPAQGDEATGPIIARAATNATIGGFVVTNQAYNGITTPTSAPAQYGSGMGVQFQRLGSGARVVVKCDATLAATLDSGSVLETEDVSWDFTNQQLIAYDSLIGALACDVLAVNIGGSQTISESSDILSWDANGTAAIIKI